jgi:medium-chain acyl-[acyl-carrier-protein] hydrolase
MAMSNPRNLRPSGAWLLKSPPNSQAHLRLFCFPYAGGGAEVFREWSVTLPEWIEVCSVQLPGRGTRLREQPFRRFGPLIKAIAEALAPYLSKPFAFFGHSMGATIAFETARELRRTGKPCPSHLLVSGGCAPSRPQSGLPTYNLPEHEFLEELRRLNGTRQEVIEHSELMQLMLPLLRADFELIQTYVYKPEPSLNCPITAFGGLHDRSVNRTDMEAWRKETCSSFTIQMFTGDHFFLHSARPLLLEVLSRELHTLISDMK